MNEKPEKKKFTPIGLPEDLMGELRKIKAAYDVQHPHTPISIPKIVGELCWTQIEARKGKSHG
jgi:hypothetical protein